MKGIAFYNEDFVTIKEDEDLLKENITRILLTFPGERVNNPLFGSHLKAFIFDLNNDVMKEDVESDIASAIARWEPRVTLDKILTETKDAKTFYIRLECTNVDTLELFTYEQILGL